jgi:Large polyvalent protein-associated domain 7
MRTVKNLTTTRASLEALFNEALPLLPQADQTGWAKQKTDMLAATERLSETNRRLEANRADIRGDTFDEPKPRDVGLGFSSELRDGEVRYIRRDAAPDRHEVAFVVRGDRVDIGDWTNRGIVLAALTLAAQKWETINVNGSESYKGSGANSRRRKASRVVLSRVQAWSTAFHTAGASRPWTARRPSPNCPLWMRCINSIPAIVIAAVAKPLKPSIVAIRCFTLRWSCSIRLFKYFDDRSFVSAGSKPSAFSSRTAR